MAHTASPATLASETTVVNPVPRSGEKVVPLATGTNDLEKKTSDSIENAVPPPPPMDFPEGGLMGWLCVLGATLIGQSFMIVLDSYLENLVPLVP